MILHHQKAAQPPIENPATVNLAETITRKHFPKRCHRASISMDDIQALLSEAIKDTASSQKPSVTFAVLQDRQVLTSLSDDATAYANREVRDHLPRIYKRTDFDIFHGAGTLIVVYGDNDTKSAPSDCRLVAENIMLGACSKGFDACLSGLAIAVLNTTWWKERLGVQSGAKAIAPIIIGGVK